MTAQFVNVQDLYALLEHEANKMVVMSEESFVAASEACKLILYGKREIMETLIESIPQIAVDAKEIADTQRALDNGDFE